MNLIEQTRERAQALAGQAVAVARETTRRGADGLQKVNRPVQQLTAAGLGLNRISADYVQRALQQQAQMVEHVLEHGAARLRTAAGAQSLRGLWREQLALVPAGREQLVADARAAFGIVRETAGALRGLVRETVQTLRPQPAAAVQGDKPGPATRRAKKADSVGEASKPAKH